MSGKVTMLESGVRGFANAVKRLAVKDKKFAENWCICMEFALKLLQMR